MQIHPIRTVVGRAGLFGLILAVVAACSLSAQQSTSQTPARLLPSSCPLTVEIDDLPLVLRELRRARRLFGLRPATGDAAEAVEGDEVTWSPAESLAGALMHAFRWSHGRATQAYLAERIAACPDRMAVGWIAIGEDRLAPVMLVRLPPRGSRRPPGGVRSVVVRGFRILAVEQVTLDRASAHLAEAGRLTAERSATSGVCRVRLQPRLLLDRMQSSSVSAFAALRHFLVDWPSGVEIDWRAGRETIRFGALRFADRLASTGPIAPPPYVGCSIRWAGRLAIPDGLEGLQDLFERDPLGIGAAVVRAWPGLPPDRDTVAHHLSGRFQVLLVRGRGSFAPVPVVGLEMVSAKRGLALLDRLLVGTGLCDRFQHDPFPYTYVRRLPPDLRANRMLINFFRVRGPQRRHYGVGLSGNWVWLGPLDEVKRVMRAMHAEDRPVTATATRDRVGGPFSAGELDVDAYALWEDLDFQQSYISREAPRLDGVEKQLRATAGELAGVMRRPQFTVMRDESSLALTRATSLADSMFSFLAARASRFHAVVVRAERVIRREVRRELSKICRAQATYRRLEGRYADSLDELTRVGLWKSRPDAEARAFRLGLRIESDGFVAFAVPRNGGLGGRLLPAYAMRGDGVLLAGPWDRDSAGAWSKAGPRLPGWRRVEVE